LRKGGEKGGETDPGLVLAGIIFLQKKKKKKEIGIINYYKMRPSMQLVHINQDLYLIT
jgi:methylmalonyl-CoA mutase cobalamin-binding subunit